ncbi:MAG: T9SS type A sorting domain-containing protein [Rhodothermaceae bacterium]|nr:T9SS type A sorting domain-containing protein [Rhodothermaceae bacterium]
MLRFLLLAFALPLAVAAQPTQTILFPGETDATLRQSLRDTYRPMSVTGTNDDLYDTVDRTEVGGQDGVIGVYTGFFVPFDGVPSSDPSQDMFNAPNENTQGINQEHTWPQSLLTGQADDDLHNLFPTKVNVNAARGNLPFAEIPDNLTTTWYRDNLQQSATPDAGVIDEFSELRAGVAFEPREDHKGNVARALFYMATVYDVQTNTTFSFDMEEQTTLYGWHYADPVDQAEYDRTFRIAPFQSNQPNPFVLDSTLIRRAFFPEITTATDAEPPSGLHLSAPAPNPFRDATTLTLTMPEPTVVRIAVFDALGRQVAVLHDGLVSTQAPLSIRLEGTRLPPGLYLIRVTGGSAHRTRRVLRIR